MLLRVPVAIFVPLREYVTLENPDAESIAPPAIYIEPVVSWLKVRRTIPFWGTEYVVDPI